MARFKPVRTWGINEPPPGHVLGHEKARPFNLEDIIQIYASLAGISIEQVRARVDRRAPGLGGQSKLTGDEPMLGGKKEDYSYEPKSG